MSSQAPWFRASRPTQTSYLHRLAATVTPHFQKHPFSISICISIPISTIFHHFSTPPAHPRTSQSTHTKQTHQNVSESVVPEENDCGKLFDVGQLTLQFACPIVDSPVGHPNLPQ
mmetsp:Transcript_3196/g.5544  ORF Transcript_3196/g.5544 Transcript_3196/m.5544 type:complete len:115 (-) Transcript_3196:3581-3925(-)